jgi:hypothetical protein
MKRPKVKISYPGVYLEEIPAKVRNIPGVSTSTSGYSASAKKRLPQSLIASGYKIVEAKIESGGLALLLAKGKDHILVRMSDVREGGGVEGRLIVTFVAKVP